jgi:hypothetical protein
VILVTRCYASELLAPLDELGLVGKLKGATGLMNNVTHPAIVEDSTSPLECTLSLGF